MRVDDELLKEFLLDANDHLAALNDGLLDIEKEPNNPELINNVFRAAHTLKGNSSAMGFSEISNLSHMLENVLEDIRAGNLGINTDIVTCLLEAVDTLEEMTKSLSRTGSIQESPETFNKLETLLSGQKKPQHQKNMSDSRKTDHAKPSNISNIRVDAEKLDLLVDFIGEIVITKSRLLKISSEIKKEELDTALDDLDRVSKDLQNLAVSLRAVSVAHVLDKFPRMIRDLAKKNGKEIEFKVEGKDIEIDRAILDKLKDILVHILRNSTDHGIETPAIRRKNKKSEKGLLSLSVLREKDHIKVLVKDDGAGIDTDLLKKNAVERGLLNSEDAQKISDEEAVELIFRPGISGAKTITEISGRGVGMDAVKEMTSGLGGSIEVETKKGRGTTFTLRLPLSLAIINALLVTVKDDVFAVPTKDVVEVLNPHQFKTAKLITKDAIIHRDEPLPVINIGKALKIPDINLSYNKLLVIEKSNKRMAVAVGEVLKQEEIVVKSVSEGLNKVRSLSGATVLGDGRVALILDIKSLV